MLKFNMEDLNPYTRFDIDNDAFIELRTMSDKAKDDLRKKIYKKVERKTKQGIRYHEDVLRDGMDEDSFESCVWDFCIGSWGGLVSESGDPIENTTENKLMLIKGSPAFSDMVNSYLDEVKANKITYREESEKNA